MKKIVTCIVAFLLCFAFAAQALAGSYLGNPRSMKYHFSNCRTIKHPENFVPFGSAQEAEAAGYARCGVCKPY